MIAALLAALWTNTAQVEGIAATESRLWAATGGGVEEYALPAGTRTALYTTEQGLDSNAVHQVWIEEVGVGVRTDRSICLLRQGRFACSVADGVAPAVPAIAPRFQGARETARLRVGSQTVVATAGAGLWLDGRRITPTGQICTNDVHVLAEFQGHLWVGGFDGGLCVLEDSGSFHTVAAPFRMINDLLATPRGLYVAAGEGLFFSPDGRKFHRDGRVRDRGPNRLALSRGRLYVTTPAALYELHLTRPNQFRRWSHPAGSTSLQAVAIGGRTIWLASEDRGVIRFYGGKFVSFDRASGLPSSWVVDVAAAPGGGVWATTLRNGAVRLDSNGKVREASEPRAHALLRTARGVWIGTEGGLAMVAR